MHRQQCNAMQFNTMRCGCAVVAAVVDMLAQDGHQEMDAKRCKKIKRKCDKNKQAAGNINTVNETNNNNNNSIKRMRENMREK